MFKVPEWEEDIPKTNVNFTKVVPNKRNKNEKVKIPRVSKQHDFMKPSLKAKDEIKSKSKFNFEKNEFKSDSGTSKLSQVFEIHDKKPKKKKQKEKIKQTYNKPEKQDGSIVLKKYGTDKLDEMIFDTKRKKLNSLKNDDVEESLFNKSNKKVENENPSAKNKLLNGKINKPVKSKKEKNKLKQIIEVSIIKSTPAENLSEKSDINLIKTKKERKKETLKSLLQNGNRNPINISNSSTLRDRMLERLKAAKFRYLNEKLYTSSGSDAQQLFQSDPEAFKAYHEGYQQQVNKWPVKPLDVTIQRIQKMPKTHKIADMGCGEAELSKRIPHTVRSFDLVSAVPGVESCNISHTPLLTSSMDVAVYCLALMGTDLTEYLMEANRVLKVGGHLLIAEVESRFDNVEAFTKEVQKLGFNLKKLDKSHKVFYFMEFTKVRDSPVKKSKLPSLTLKPCIYKKR